MHETHKQNAPAVILKFESRHYVIVLTKMKLEKRKALQARDYTHRTIIRAVSIAISEYMINDDYTTYYLLSNFSEFAIELLNTVFYK